MKRKKRPTRDPKTVRKALLASTCMLLISALLAVSTSYAWLTLAVAPEVTGITTNVAANGSLEIAMLTTETRQDMSKIKTAAFGQTINTATDKMAINTTWGNLVNLNDVGYGLNEILLQPARLNLVENGDGTYTVDSALLSVPTYDIDGRIIQLSDDTVSAIYDGKGEFKAVTGKQDYGVRAIGTSSTLSVQGSALALAKANILTYTNSAKNNALAALKDNFSGLFSIIIAKSTNENPSYGEKDLAVVQNMVTGLDKSLDYIDSALRQGVLAVAASKISDVDDFTTLRDLVNGGTALSTLLTEAGITDETFSAWITAYETADNKLKQAKIACDELATKDSISWAELKGALEPLMNIDQIYIDGIPFPEMDKETLMGMVGSRIEMELISGSGIFADIADFAGEYSTTMDVMNTDVTLKVTTLKEPIYLSALYAIVEPLQPADGGDTAAEIVLDSIYGYALDMAFRTNAPVSKLLLQTEGVQRVYADSTLEATMGGGSYMEFTLNESYSLEKMLELMDAVRVGFVNDKGALLGVAKMNLSNRVTENLVVSAPLYLYDFTLSEDVENYGQMLMGERQKDANELMDLVQNTPTALSVVVWLDGDLVDNSMVSNETTLEGTLNLQFASSAELIPAGSDASFIATATTDTLKELLDKSAEKYYDVGNVPTAEKPELYTSISWNEYVAAYEHALATSENPAASTRSALRAGMDLINAEKNLTVVNVSSLKEVIKQYREMMGQTTDIAFVAVKNEDGSYTKVGAPTQEQLDGKDNVKINRVDYNKNLVEEGNMDARIYTDASWSAMAAALYQAEFFANINKTHSTEELDSTFTALETAYKTLERAVLFTPYTYDGQVYYLAIPMEENAESYGRWYDSTLTRIVADLTIIKLDAKAVAMNDYTSIIADDYIAYNATVEQITTENKTYSPIVDMTHPNILAGDEILAIDWNVDETFFARTITPVQKATLTTLIEEANALNANGNLANKISEDLLKKAEEMINSRPAGWTEGDLYYLYTYDEVKPVIDELAVAVQTAADTVYELENPIEQRQMTPNQQTLLNKAINSVKTIVILEDDEEKTKQTEIDAAVAEAEAVLADLTTLYPAANGAIAKLNGILAKYGMTEVTEHNTIQIPLPIGSEVFDLAYSRENPVICLVPRNQTGRVTLIANVITKNGITFTVTKDVTVYVDAETVGLFGDADGDGQIEVEVDADGKKVALSAMNLGDASAMQLSAELVFPVEDADDKLAYEEIAWCTWASSDPAVLKVSDTMSPIADLTYVSSGNATLSVSVTTVQGNTHTASVDITVVARPITGVTMTENGTAVTASHAAIAGDAYALSYTLTRDEAVNGFDEMPATVTWSSTAADIAEVDAAGNVTAKAAGECDIELTITAPGGNTFSATQHVVVTAPAEPTP